MVLSELAVLPAHEEAFVDVELIVEDISLPHNPSIKSQSIFCEDAKWYLVCAAVTRVPTCSVL